MRGDGPCCGNEMAMGQSCGAGKCSGGCCWGNGDNAGGLRLVGVLGMRKGASVRHEAIVRVHVLIACLCNIQVYACWR